jgi:hypothetical protein
MEDSVSVPFVVSIKGKERCFGDRKRTFEEISLYFSTLCISGHLLLLYTSCILEGALCF